MNKKINDHLEVIFSTRWYNSISLYIILYNNVLCQTGWLMLLMSSM